MGMGDRRSAQLGNFFKSSIAEVAKNQPRGFELVVRANLFNFRIDGARNQEDVQPAVIIKVHEACAPTDILSVNGQACGIRHIVEKIAFQVSVKHWRVIAEVSGKKVNPAVSVIVTGGHPHVRLLLPIAIDRNPGGKSRFGKGPIVVVAKEKVR